MPDKRTCEDLEMFGRMCAQDMYVLAFALEQLVGKPRPEGWGEQESLALNQWRGLLLNYLQDTHPMVMLPKWVYHTKEEGTAGQISGKELSQ